MTYILLVSGKTFDFLNPEPSVVEIVDIAHALSHICRFTGHSFMPYSVAQHSCLVADSLRKEHKFQGLMHDAPEYVVGDMSTPLKSLNQEFKNIEKNVWEKAICPKFGLNPELSKEVKEADYKAFLREILFLFPNQSDIIKSRLESEAKKYNIPHHGFEMGFEIWSPLRSMDEFLQRFYAYSALRVSA